MMKYLVLSAILGMSQSVFAADTKSDFKLATVDFQRALNGVEEGKSAKAKLKSEFEKKQKDLDERKNKLDKMQTELADLQKQLQSGVLKPEAREKGVKLETEFRKGLEEYTKLMQEHQRDISEKESKATTDIIAKLRSVVVDLSRTEGYSMVLESNESGLVYASASTDLTEKLIQKYNSMYKAK